VLSLHKTFHSHYREVVKGVPLGVFLAVALGVPLGVFLAVAYGVTVVDCALICWEG
jgi:hypothetical protein